MKEFERPKPISSNSLEQLGLFEERIYDFTHPLQGTFRKHEFYEHESQMRLLELVRHWRDKDDPKNLKYVTGYAEAVAGSVVSGLQMLDKLQHLHGDIFPEKDTPALKKIGEIFNPTKK